MSKKAVLILFVAMLLAFGGVAQANQIDGMVSGTGPLALPTGLHVSVNPGGLGDTLLYGYYNVRDSINFIRVVNTSQSTAIKARVRFREAKNSQEVLDFNICLTNADQWSAWLFAPTTSGSAVILPADGGLVRPSTVTDDMLTVTGPAFPSSGQSFKFGAPVLPLVTADDTKEGYFEIIGAVAKDHNTKGTCSMDNHCEWTVDECTNQQTNVDLYGDVPNTLAGHEDIYVLRADKVAALSYNALALADFANGLIDNTLLVENPNLADSQDGLAGVEYVLTKQKHDIMYNLESWSASETAAIITFPTKHHHITLDSDGKVTGSTKPFDTMTSDDCEPIDITIFNDLEDTTTTTTGFSPAAPGEQAELCNEVNVINFNDSDIVKTGVAATLSVSGVEPFTGLGWVEIGLDTGTITCSTGNSTCFGGRQTLGLPSIGFVINELVGALGSMTSTQFTTAIQ